MSNPIQEVKEKKKLRLKANQEFIAPPKTETQKKLEFDLGAEALNPLLTSEQPNEVPEQTNEHLLNNEAKKPSFKDRMKLKKKIESFNPEEHQKKEQEVPVAKPPQKFNTYNYQPQPTYMTVPPQMVPPGMMQPGYMMASPYIMQTQGYFPNYGTYQQPYYALPPYQSVRNIGPVPNYQPDGNINLKESLNTKVPYHPKPYITSHKYAQSERTVATDDYKLKHDATDEKTVGTQDISIAEPIDEDKRIDHHDQVISANKETPLTKGLIEKQPVIEEKKIVEEPKIKEEIKPIVETQQKKVEEKPKVPEIKRPEDEAVQPQKIPIHTQQVNHADADAEEMIKKGIYSADFLIGYINSYSKGLPTEFSHLDRKINEIEAPAKKPRDNFRRNGRRNDRVEVRKPSPKHYNDYRPRDQRPSEKDAPKPEVLQRQQVSEETLIQIKKIKQGADHWLATKKDDDVTVVNFKKIKSLLNKLTSDNFAKISKEIAELAQNKEIIKKLVDFVVIKAWNEPRYTKIYAELVNFLAEQKFSWDKSGKTIKREVLSKVENAYTLGFKNYYDLTKEIHENTEMKEMEKIEQLYKQKVMLLGNINFICELFFFKILSFKVFKLIIVYGIASFVKEYIRAEESKDKFTIKEDYLEALVKLFENSGKAIDKKERTEEKKSKTSGSLSMTTEEHILDEFYIMIDNREDRTESFMEKERLDKYVKTLNSVSYIFFELLKKFKHENISVRLQSLITNLEEFKDSNWTVEVHKVGAAKSKHDIQKELEREKDKANDRDRDRDRYDDDGYDNYNSRRGGRESYVSSGKGFRKNTKPKGNNDGYFEKKTAKTKSIPDMCKDISAYFKENKNALNEDKFITLLDDVSNRNYKDVLTAFFITFARNPQSSIAVIIHYPYLLLKDDYINPSDFETATGIANHALCLEFSDLPFLQANLATILYDCVVSDLITLGNFAWECPKELQDDKFDSGEYSYYCRELLDAVEKKFKAENQEAMVADAIKEIRAKLEAN